MSEYKRQHPVAAITNVLKSLRELLVPLVIVFFIGGGGGGNGFFSNPYYLGIFFSVILIGSVVSWWRYTYRVEDNELRIEYGLFVRNKSYIPKHRIQVINVSSGILQRMFGLVSLNVQTAGGNTPGATISALTKEEAQWIKNIMSKSDDDALNDTSEESEIRREPEITPVRALSFKHLLIAGTTSASFGVALSIIGTIMAQLQYVDDDKVLGYLEDFFKSDVTFIFVLIAGMILISWLLSIFGTVLAYANFRISKTEKQILINRGLFEKKQITLPYTRIQAIRIQEGVLRQPFGYCALYVDSAGFGEQSGKSTVLFPLIRKSEAWDFIREVIPQYDQIGEKVRPPMRALRRYLIRTMIPIILFGGLIHYFTDFGWYVLALLPLGGLLGYMRFKAASLSLNDDAVIIRYRTLARTTAIVLRHRIQAVSAWDNWFQRKKNLKSATINIASSDTGASFSARDFEEDVALNLVEWAEPQYLKKKKKGETEPASPTENFDSGVSDWLDTGF
jgi:putative membrane protein